MKTQTQCQRPKAILWGIDSNMPSLVDHESAWSSVSERGIILRDHWRKRDTALNTLILSMDSLQVICS
jgi:hypothetical protein